MIISPFSVAMALSLLSQATNGTTFEELRKGLHLNIDKAAIAEKFHQYHGLLVKSAGESEFIVANRIFIQQEYELRTEFKEVATKQFFSSVQSLNFKDAIDAARTINQFVKEKTKNKIAELVQPEIFVEYSRAFLANVIYLKRYSDL